MTPLPSHFRTFGVTKVTVTFLILTFGSSPFREPKAALASTGQYRPKDSHDANTNGPARVTTGNAARSSFPLWHRLMNALVSDSLVIASEHGSPVAERIRPSIGMFPIRSQHVS